jgi:hypothetical protein
VRAERFVIVASLAKVPLPSTGVSGAEVDVAIDAVAETEDRLFLLRLLFLAPFDWF